MALPIPQAKTNALINDISSRLQSRGGSGTIPGYAIPLRTADFVPIGKAKVGFGVGALLAKPILGNMARGALWSGVKNVGKSALSKVFGGTLKQRAGRFGLALSGYELAHYSATGEVPIPTPRKLAGFASFVLNPVTAFGGLVSGFGERGIKGAKSAYNFFDNNQFPWEKQKIPTKEELGWSSYLNNPLPFDFQKELDKLPQQFPGIQFNFPETPSFGGVSGSYSPYIGANMQLGGGMDMMPYLMLLLGGLGGGYLLGRRKRKRKKYKRKKPTK